MIGGICIKTLRIIGVSGVGKTTLIESLIKKYPELVHASYGDFFRKYGSGLANIKLREFMFSKEGLVLLDEHLEFGDEDLSKAYFEEKTVGLFLMEVTPDELLMRRKSDLKRERSLNKDEIILEQIKSRDRSVCLAKKLNLPLELVLNGKLEENLFLLELFIRRHIYADM